jgi:AraC-like DNA-binding protein
MIEAAAAPLRIVRQTHDSRAGRWTMAFCPARPPLDGFVDALWQVCGQATYTVERILPAGSVELMITLGPAHHLLDPQQPGRRTAFRDAWVAGLQQRWLIAESERTNLIAVRLKPLGARLLFGGCAAELGDRVIPLDTVIGPAASALRQRLLDSPSLEDRFRVLERFVLERVLAAPPVPRWIGHAVATIERSHGRTRIAALGQTLGVSERHLERRFREQVGLGPKRYARLLRFAGVIDRLRRVETMPWTEVALELGYYDQSHLIRDFRTFAGASPEEFLRRRAPDGTSLIEH